METSQFEFSKDGTDDQTAVGQNRSPPCSLNLGDYLCAVCAHHRRRCSRFGRSAPVPVGAITAPVKLAEPIANTLFFAGEATNTAGHSGTVHGAIATRYRAADEILALISRKAA